MKRADTDTYDISDVDDSNVVVISSASTFASTSQPPVKKQTCTKLVEICIYPLSVAENKSEAPLADRKWFEFDPQHLAIKPPKKVDPSKAAYGTPYFISNKEHNLVFQTPLLYSMNGITEYKKENTGVNRVVYLAAPQDWSDSVRITVFKAFLDKLTRRFAEMLIELKVIKGQTVDALSNNVCNLEFVETTDPNDSSITHVPSLHLHVDDETKFFVQEGEGESRDVYLVPQCDVPKSFFGQGIVQVRWLFKRTENNVHKFRVNMRLDQILYRPYNRDGSTQIENGVAVCGIIG